MRKSRLAGIAAALLVAAGMSVVTAPQAMAIDGYVDMRFCGPGAEYRCGYGGTSNLNTRVYSCDTYSDGFGLRIYYLGYNGLTGYIDDANGSDSGCSARYPGQIVSDIMACSTRPDSYEICSKWVRVYP